MGNIIYILKRLKTMDKKAMFEKINSIHSKTKMSKLKIFLDMQKCAELLSRFFKELREHKSKKKPFDF